MPEMLEGKHCFPEKGRLGEEVELEEEQGLSCEIGNDY